MKGLYLVLLLAGLIALGILNKDLPPDYTDIASSVYMIDDNERHRWHPECGFPHNWDNNIEYIIDNQQFRIHHG